MKDLLQKVGAALNSSVGKMIIGVLLGMLVYWGVMSPDDAEVVRDAVEQLPVDSLGIDSASIDSMVTDSLK